MSSTRTLRTVTSLGSTRVVPLQILATFETQPRQPATSAETVPVVHHQVATRDRLSLTSVEISTLLPLLGLACVWEYQDRRFSKGSETAHRICALRHHRH